MDKKELIKRVVVLAREGHNDSEIGRIVDIHRTTVKRYRERGDKGAIGTEARVRVIQEALSQHFVNLCQVCERLRNGVRAGQPEKVMIEDLHNPHALTMTLSGGRGNEITVTVSVGEGRIKIDHLSIEEELIFASLKQHTGKSSFWKLYQEWKDKFAEYISNLSNFYDRLVEESKQQNGLEIGGSDNHSGLTSYFAHVIFQDVCAHAFFGYRGFEGTDYAINTLKVDWYELRFGGTVIAHNGDRGTLETCQKVHQQMMEYFRMPESHPPEILSAVKVYQELKRLEAQINLELERLVLKRTFSGRCELCPD